MNVFLSLREIIMPFGGVIHGLHVCANRPRIASGRTPVCIEASRSSHERYTTDWCEAPKQLSTGERKRGRVCTKHRKRMYLLTNVICELKYSYTLSFCVVYRRDPELAAPTDSTHPAVRPSNAIGTDHTDYWTRGAGSIAETPTISW
jgi:hypothetical protein